ncbi:oxidoreductase, NAD-binding domain protein [Cutibacterium avidum]|nr:oxidoreductase, NAD-binding domain protein [Cutibacterium avidum]
MTATNPIRVVQWGLGAMGQGMAKLITSKDGLDLVGAIDVNPALDGKDVGEVLGVDPLGVHVTTDPSTILDSDKVDVVTIATTSWVRDQIADLRTIITAGINVVSIAEEMSCPEAQNPEMAKELDELAKSHGVSAVGVGVNPGFVLDHPRGVQGRSRRRLHRRPRRLPGIHPTPQRRPRPRGRLGRAEHRAHHRQGCPSCPRPHRRAGSGRRVQPHGSRPSRGPRGHPTHPSAAGRPGGRGTGDRRLHHHHRRPGHLDVDRTGDRWRQGHRGYLRQHHPTHRRRHPRTQAHHRPALAVCPHGTVGLRASLSEVIMTETLNTTPQADDPVPEGTWVEVRTIILQPSERAAAVPADTAATPSCSGSVDSSTRRHTSATRPPSPQSSVGITPASSTASIPATATVSATPCPSC